MTAQSHWCSQARPLLWIEKVLGALLRLTSTDLVYMIPGVRPRTKIHRVTRGTTMTIMDPLLNEKVIRVLKNVDTILITILSGALVMIDFSNGEKFREAILVTVISLQPFHRIPSISLKRREQQKSDLKARWYFAHASFQPRIERHLPCPRLAQKPNRSMQVIRAAPILCATTRDTDIFFFGSILPKIYCLNREVYIFWTIVFRRKRRHRIWLF
ncbi:hypothetical protein BX666DRAFT_315028 [Dichotomocladium elegans]|nr:hypothetical protein BX666DRAFT_315028 [Dichotomocladium elegans]